MGAAGVAWLDVGRGAAPVAGAATGAFRGGGRRADGLDTAGDVVVTGSAAVAVFGHQVTSANRLVREAAAGRCMGRLQLLGGRRRRVRSVRERNAPVPLRCDDAVGGDRVTWLSRDRT